MVFFFLFFFNVFSLLPFVLCHCGQALQVGASGTQLRSTTVVGGHHPPAQRLGGWVAEASSPLCGAEALLSKQQHTYRYTYTYTYVHRYGHTYTGTAGTVVGSSYFLILIHTQYVWNV